MNAELQKAIHTAERLFKERNSAEWWGANIIDAGRCLQTKQNWTKFYAYLSNPSTFNPNIEYKTLEDEESELDQVTLDYEDLGMKEYRFENGNETIIHVRLYKKTHVLNQNILQTKG